jgi:hypothetical protein
MTPRGSWGRRRRHRLRLPDACARCARLALPRARWSAATRSAPPNGPAASRSRTRARRSPRPLALDGVDAVTVSTPPHGVAGMVVLDAIRRSAAEGGGIPIGDGDR